MRPISRTVLARQLAAAIVDAACEDQGAWWSEREAEHAAAVTREQAAAASAPALVFCVGCVEVNRCAQRAEVDQYTGLAAGSAWLNGRVKPPAAIQHRPEPPHQVKRAS